MRPNDLERPSRRSAASLFALVLASALVLGALDPTSLEAAAPPGNTRLGKSALKGNTGANNTAIGFYALNPNYLCTAAGVPSACCTGASKGSCGNGGDGNTALGSAALTSNTTGNANVAVGYAALLSSTASENVAVGHQAAANNTTGSTNTALGTAALFTNTTGNGSTAVGYRALAFSNNNDNTAVGNAALGSTTTGVNNTATGRAALFFNTTSSNNTALGANALFNSTGASNIAVGSFAGVNLTTGNGNIAIGNSGLAAESNTIRIGAAQTATYIAGISGATSAGGVAVFVDGAGRLGTITSSARFKEDIQDIGDGSSVLMKLRPVRFHYRQDVDPSGIEQYGLVAEEVAKVDPDLVVYDEKGEPRTVRYHFVNALLLNEVQRQARRAEAQQSEIAAQRRDMDALQRENAALAAQVRRMSGEARQIDSLSARLLELEKALGAATEVRRMPVRSWSGPG